MKSNTLIILIIISIAFTMAGAIAEEDLSDYVNEANVTTLESHNLSIPDKGIECTLTYERHDLSVTISEKSLECPIIYDLPILSGNLPGIDLINETIRIDYQSFLGKVHGEYGIENYLSMYSEEDDLYPYEYTDIMNIPVYCGSKELRTGLQYYDGRYISLLFFEEDTYYPAGCCAYAKTYDMFTGDEVSIADLLGDTDEIKNGLCDAVRKYLSPKFDKYTEMREDMLNDMEYYLSCLNLHEAEFFLTEEGEIYLFEAAFSSYFGEMGILPTGVSFHGRADKPTVYSVFGNDDRDILISGVLGDTTFEKYIMGIKSWEYDPKLSYLLMGMARASYNNSCIGSTLYSMGYKNVTTNHYGDNNFGLAYHIASKELDGSLFVLIILRGSTTLGNWVRNFEISIDINGYHAGFKSSEEELYKMLKAHLAAYLQNENVPTKNVTYVIAGHSAGAAVGNLLTVDLQTDGVPVSSLFDYNFSCPDLAWDEHGNWLGMGEYSSIFNIADFNDPVSYLPGKGGWGKYGHSYWFAHDWADDGFSFDYHSCENYQDYLAQLPNLDRFRIWDEVFNIRMDNLQDDLVAQLRIIG